MACQEKSTREEAQGKEGAVGGGWEGEFRENCWKLQYSAFADSISKPNFCLYDTEIPAASPEKQHWHNGNIMCRRGEGERH